MPELQKGRYSARQAAGEADLARAEVLRALVFRGGSATRDRDLYDSRCQHMLIEETATGSLVATFRILPLASGAEVGSSYSAQYYELSPLAAYPGPMVELGRFCLHPERHDPDILRLAWAAITRIVDARGAGLLFGCSSFRGTDAESYLDCFALLRNGHIAPKRWLPKVKAPRVFRFARRLRARMPDRAAGLSRMPPLLRSYLAMGGWVSDHAVIDGDLGTLHVFTGLEIGRIPPARARALRAIAG